MGILIYLVVHAAFGAQTAVHAAVQMGQQLAVAKLLKYFERCSLLFFRQSLHLSSALIRCCGQTPLLP